MFSTSKKTYPTYLVSATTNFTASVPAFSFLSFPGLSKALADVVATDAGTLLVLLWSKKKTTWLVRFSAQPKKEYI